MSPDHSLVAGTDDLDLPAGYPFRGPGLLVRIAPFAAIAVLAEASLALMSGPVPGAAVVVSMVLLLAVAAAFALPWERLPDWLVVLMPLAYTGSVLALILAAGSDSGVGIVILVPLIWTALFHRRWESACIVVAIVAVEVIISLTPVTVADSVIVRRIILWAALGTVTAIATHELRERSSRARWEAARLHDQLTELKLAQDRDRIAADLQDTVIQQVFAAGMNLNSTAMLATQPEVRKRILAAAGDLDEVLRLTRDAVFGLERHLQGRGLRAEIVALCEKISPAPEVSFTGPVDGALDPDRTVQLMHTLRDALDAISPHAPPRRVAVSASDSVYTAEIETARPVPAGNPRPSWLAELSDSAAEAGFSLTVQPGPRGTRFTWSVPLLVAEHSDTPLADPELAAPSAIASCRPAELASPSPVSRRRQPAARLLSSERSG
jgi:signal transduction histidine kinase